MCQLLAEQLAGWISGERSPALLDSSINYLKVLFDNCNGRRVELSLSLPHDLLEHVDLFTVDSLRLLTISNYLTRQTRGGTGAANPSVTMWDTRVASAARRADASDIY